MAQHLAHAAGPTPRLPVSHFDVVNGSAHTAGNLDLQEFILTPIGGPNLPEAERGDAEVRSPVNEFVPQHACRPAGGTAQGRPRLGSPRHGVVLTC